MDIKPSIERLIAVKEDQDKVNQFAIDKFWQEFQHEDIPRGSWRAYSRFEILSPTKLRVHYDYGAGDMEMSDYFDVEI